MGLSGGLSNTGLSTALAGFADLRGQRCRIERPPLVGYSDGRREFGTVSAAIRKVMEEDGGGLSPAEVARRCEKVLGGTVSRFTVGDHLLKHSRGDARSYERYGRGLYRMLDASEEGGGVASRPKSRKGAGER